MQNSNYEDLKETKQHSNTIFPYNTYLCTIPLDFTQVPMHWHKEMELIVIKKGEGIITVNLIPHQVTAGNIIFILPGQLHSIRQKANCTMEYENILFLPSILKATGEDYCNTHFFQPLFSGILEFPSLLNEELSYYPSVASAIQQIDDLCSTRPFGYQLAVKGQLFQIFYTLVSHHPVHNIQNRQKKSLDKVKLVLTYIQENYSKPISIEEIAEVCFYSKSHFMKFFKGAMGMGFTQYLNDYRLDIASQQLRSTNDTILEIAARTGFDNLSYFNRIFKKRFGMTPGQYRK